VEEVSAAEKLEQRGEDMAAGKETREQRSEKATKGEIEIN
jgi:hypothetical protein